MFLTFIRTIKEAWSNFLRNGWLSVAAVSVMFFSIFIISILFIVGVTADGVINGIQNKVNVSVYLKSDVSEDKIMEIKQEMERFDVVKSVEYISKEKALENFKESNKDEPRILQALEEIGSNPLLPALIIKSNDSSKYDLISEYISNASFKEDVSRVNYGKTKEIISKLNAVILDVKMTGMVLAGIFALISILIIFNTIRITIYTHKQEVEIMRLVGASNSYIRIPFIFEGIIYGLIAMIICMAVLFAVLKFASPYITKLIPTENIISLYVENIWKLLAIQFLSGVFLGILSSWIAVRKYLKI